MTNLFIAISAKQYQLPLNRLQGPASPIIKCVSFGEFAGHEATFSNALSDWLKYNLWSGLLSGGSTELA